jgi:CheY-like chemotaxis protein
LVAERVAGMHDLLDRTLGPLVTVSLDLADAHVPVLSDPTQVEMALLNMAINARDAMPDGGELCIQTRARTVTQDPDLEPGEYIELAVIDTGTGMSPEVAARAFDPFFTTKTMRNGQGTGLGLSQVHAIARQSGGVARIDTHPGRGTTVRLLLRRTDQEVPNDPVRYEGTQLARQPTATVLVVDDDADVRRFLADALQAIGYRVEAAGDGVSGLAALDQLAPDVLVVDYAMPGMNGAEVARAARDRRPNLPIVFASGYSDTAAIESVVGVGATVLRKPFRIDQLHAAIVNALPPPHCKSVVCQL